MVFQVEFLIILGAVAIACAMGFHKYIWFISIGYGFAISAVGICLIPIYFSELDTLKVIAAILFIAYGIRLGGYLLLRELKSASYNKKMEGEISDGSGMSMGLKILLWLSCVLLYFMMTAPVIYRFSNGVDGDLCLGIGMVILLCGVILESASDYQKSRAKKANPGRFCDQGLFKLVRCPNYLGELLIWTGVIISGFTAQMTIGQWIVSIIGYLGIVYVMFSGARRLELRQDRTYGEDPEYQEYVKNTPIMLPFIPLYSVKKYKWLVG